MHKQKNLFFTITHTFQADDGFRKTKILNTAVLLSKSEYIVFINSDCILHPKFLQQHYTQRQEKTALFGRRVMLSASITKKMYAYKNIQKLHLINFGA